MIENEVMEVFDLQVKRSSKEQYSEEIKSVFLLAYERILMVLTTPLKGLRRKIALAQLVDFTIGEFDFYRLEQKDAVLTDQQLALKVVYRYVAWRLAQDDKAEKKGYKPYNHYISTLQTAALVFESINAPLSKHDPNFSLLNDLFETTFQKIIGSTEMFIIGLFLDSYVSWRTIHESESTLKLLVENGDKTKNTYVKHIVYSNLYYNPDSFDDEYRNSVFDNQIKVEMAQHGLKSKDMKKYLEYGWLYSCKEYDMEKHPKFKLNFNDGVDELAGLRDRYNEFYRGTSEIAHSSSIFYYANEEGIKNISLMLTYESAYRIFTLYMKFMDEYFQRQEKERELALNCLDEVKSVSEFLTKKYDEE